VLDLNEKVMLAAAENSEFGIAGVVALMSVKNLIQ
jgi:hypothetical protein